MISMLSNWLNNSIASLSIYDIFIIILFILVLILCIVSGVIIVSARVKKVNLELNKSKDIQDVQSKIITNRLDLILNKLNNNLLLNNLTNKDIKNAIIENSNDNINSEDFIENNNIPKIPSILSDEANNNNTNISTSSSIVDSSNQNESSSPTTEHLNIDQEKLPKDIHLNEISPYNISENKENNEEKIIDISENLNKKNSIPIDINSKNIKDNTENEVNSTFEKGESIPLDINNDKKFKSEQQVEKSRSEEYDSQECYTPHNIDNITLANKILNELEAFSNEEKFNITNIISEDGKHIENLTNNEISKLSKKELIKQLFIQMLVSSYDYPLKNIEVNYNLNLAHNIYKKADIIVFDKNDESYILVIIDTKNEHIHLNTLTHIAQCIMTPFIIWTDGNIITYYKNLNGKLKEVSDIPPYNKDIFSNKSSGTSPYVSRPLRTHTISNRRPHYISRENNIYDSLNRPPIQNNPQYFSSDMFNIFKKEPYSLSDEYKSIISQYKNFSSTYANKVMPVIRPYNNLPLNNFLPLKDHINNNCNNFLNTNTPPLYNNIDTYNNFSPYSNFNGPSFQQEDYMLRELPIPPDDLNNNPNLPPLYNDPFYKNNYNLPCMDPNINSQVRFDNNLPGYLPNNIRFNNYNMFPKYL